MKRIILFFILIHSVVFVFSQSENKIDSLMTSIYKNDSPGAAIAIVKNGKICFKRGYGTANIQTKSHITSSTNFNICSMTKQFTAYCILKLASENKLSLNDKIDKYFPEFNYRVAHTITVKNLLTHTSGIIDHYDHVDKTAFIEFWDKDVLNAIKSIDSVYFAAGSQYRYSNTAYCLLSLIIERVSGLTFSEYVHESIFKPLGMENSDIIKSDFKIAERALGYDFDKGSFEIADAGESLFFSTRGDGGIYTSIDDFLKWILDIQNSRILDPSLISEAQSPQFTIDITRNISYGFGWFVAGSGVNKLIYHTGSNGGFRTIIFIKPSEKYAVVIFSNRTGIDLEDLIREINKINKIDDHAFVKLESLIS